MAPKKKPWFRCYWALRDFCPSLTSGHETRTEMPPKDESSVGRRVRRTTRPDGGTYWGEIREEAPGEWRARILVKNGNLIVINQVLQRRVPKDAALIWVDQRLDAIASRDAGWTPA